MTLKDKWLLPDGVDELMPDSARKLEMLRRAVMDTLTAWGYELVEPPLVEYLDSLLSGVGEDLDLQTSKMLDQRSGRMLGLRADMTPQVTRMATHRLARSGPTRLCYCGPVFHSRPDRFLGSRNPLQVGAELYGHAGVESDVEIATVMLEVLRHAGFPEPTIDVAHVGVVRGLIDEAGLDADTSLRVRDILTRKATPELAEFIDQTGIAAPFGEFLLALPRLYGDDGIIERARELAGALAAPVTAALDDLAAFSAALGESNGALSITYDLAETRGYHYHTGLSFTAYVPGQGQEVAWGGRYDDIGAVFGTPRPATGFSTDLKRLVMLAESDRPDRNAILAPAESDPDLEHYITLLREQGEIVVRALPGCGEAVHDYNCQRRLVRVDDGWRVD